MNGAGAVRSELAWRFTALLAIAMLGIPAPQRVLAAEATHAAPRIADLWDESEVDALIHEGLRDNSNGHFDAAARVWKRLGEAAPQHPAANVHAVDTLVWLQVFDNVDTRFDDRIVQQSEEGIRKAKAWVKARPSEARAHLYLGQALMSLGRLHGIRLRIYRAGLYGERARKELERALELDPSLTDAKYSIGLYAYYASAIPDLVQWLSFLWFIPTADAPLGLRYLEEVRRDGDLYQFSAAFYLANIRWYHDKWLDYPFALSTLEKLRKDHPRNSLIHFELLEVLLAAGRYEDVLRESRELESHPGTGRHDRGRANMGRIWRARAEVLLARPELGWRLLERFGEDGPMEPSWGNRWVHSTRGQIKDAMGERAQAIAEYERVMALKLNPKFDRATKIANKGVDEAFRLPLRISVENPQTPKN